MEIQLNEDLDVKSQIYGKFLNRVGNVPLPATFIRTKRFATRPTWIIIHDTNCLNHSDSVLTIDGPNTGMGALKMNDINKDGLADVNFHFIVDQLSKDYEVIAGRPVSVMAKHDDIESAYNNALHVIILSDLNVDLPKIRLYKILAYRCLAPMIKMLKMGSDPANIIKFHDQVMKDKNSSIKCPGDFLAREMLIDQTRRHL